MGPVIDDETMPLFLINGFLEAGKTHTLTMTVVMGDTREIVQTLYDDISLLSSVLLSINQLTGSDPDPNYDYQFF